VASLLLHLDEEFREVGFGSWMPFRYPDQWLMFCGLLKKVLAANGLMYAEHADTYRRLLDETPVADPHPADFDERKKWWETPKNWAKAYSNRGASNMEELRKRLLNEVWQPKDEYSSRAPPLQLW
jgi:hypothetical protein